jgi:hypothetical protein
MEDSLEAPRQEGLRLSLIRPLSIPTGSGTASAICLPCCIYGENQLVGPIRQLAYCTISMILNMGRYIEIRIEPTIAPRTIIMSGSIMLVSALTACSTSSS